MSTHNINGSKKERHNLINGEEDVEQIKEIRKLGHDEIVESCRTILKNIGEDVEREGLLKTPDRMAKAFSFFTSGYEVKLEGNKFVYFFLDFQLKRFLTRCPK